MDSLGKNINCKFTSKTVFLPGATIKAAEEKISEIPNLNRYKTILVCFGTNDLSPKFVWLSYKRHVRKNGDKPFNVPKHPKMPIHLLMEDYKGLLDTIRRHNPTAKILVSAIIPRYFDWASGKEHLIATNRELEKLCKTYGNLSYIPSYKCLLKSGRPVKENYCSDGLHLSTNHGAVIIKRYFNHQISEHQMK